MSHLIPAADLARYSASPSASKVAAAKSLHENVRSLLGTDYDTFLQGSYRNDTGVADINDVDIVALRKTAISTVFTGRAAVNPISWEQIFDALRSKIESSHHYRGKTERGDKCITIHTDFKADVVPAVKIPDDGSDPIAVYSFSDRSERKNYPRTHYQNNVNKQSRTNDAYKPTVRMFKRWARNWFPSSKVAPSFDVECLVYGVPDEKFMSDGAYSFFMVGHHITNTITTSSAVMSVAGDKDILVRGEWDPADYEQFRTTLDTSLSTVAQALNASSIMDARTYWREAFNE